MHQKVKLKSKFSSGGKKIRHKLGEPHPEACASSRNLSHILLTIFSMSIRRTSTTHRLIENGCKDFAGADGRVRVVGELEEEEDGAREELDHGDDDPGVDLGRDSEQFKTSPKTIKKIYPHSCL